MFKSMFTGWRWVECVGRLLVTWDLFSFDFELVPTVLYFRYLEGFPRSESLSGLSR